MKTKKKIQKKKRSKTRDSQDHPSSNPMISSSDISKISLQKWIWKKDEEKKKS